MGYGTAVKGLIYIFFTAAGLRKMSWAMVYDDLKIYKQNRSKDAIGSAVN